MSLTSKTMGGTNGDRAAEAAAAESNGHALLAPLDAKGLILDQIERIIWRPRPENHVVGYRQAHPAAAEKFRLLTYRLNQIRRSRPLNSVLITSTVPQEGKTMATLNLAVTLATANTRVLLVDADLRRPALHAALGLQALPGLAEYLEGEAEIWSLCRCVGPFGFFYLPAGQALVRPAELLQSPKMDEFLEAAEGLFDWVLFDSPPLVLFADAHCLAGLVDAALLVVRTGFTRREDFRRSLTALKGAMVAGLIVNGAEDKLHSIYSDYYDVTPVRRLAGAPNTIFDSKI